jgi:PBP1b-binding outer membrane lipoprotein LpoB
MKHTLIILSAFVLFGCASRKTNKTEVKETTELKAIDTTKTVTESEKTENSLDTSTINEIEIIPIDNTKPIIYNNKKVFNGILRLKTTKVNKVVEIKEKVATVEQKGVNKSRKQVIEVKQKETERKSFFSWLWLLLLIPIYFIYRKLKNPLS